MRLWMFEQPERACWTDTLMVFDPLLWARTGPGDAADGKPRFDLSVWNDAYFTRLRKRVVQAGERGQSHLHGPWQGLYLGATEEVAGWSFTGGISKDQRDYPDWEPTRRAMGDTRRYAMRVDLAKMTPHPELVSTRW